MVSDKLLKMAKSNAKDVNKYSEKNKEHSTESTGNISDDGISVDIPVQLMMGVSHGVVSTSQQGQTN